MCTLKKLFKFMIFVFIERRREIESEKIGQELLHVHVNRNFDAQEESVLIVVSIELYNLSANLSILLRLYTCCIAVFNLMHKFVM